MLVRITVLCSSLVTPLQPPQHHILQYDVRTLLHRSTTTNTASNKLRCQNTHTPGCCRLDVHRRSTSDRPRDTMNASDRFTVPALSLTSTYEATTLTFNPRRAMIMTHTHGKIKVKGQSVQNRVKIDGRTRPIAVPSLLAYSAAGEYIPS